EAMVRGTFRLAGTLSNNPAGSTWVSLPVSALADADAGQWASSTGGSGNSIGTAMIRNDTDNLYMSCVLQLRSATTAWLIPTSTTTNAFDASEQSWSSGKLVVVAGQFSYWPA